MILTVDENPNCEMPDPRVFQERSEPVAISHVLRLRGGQEVWCSITAWGKEGPTGSALARKVDDSGEGTCYLVYGGPWGLRLKDPVCQDAWSVTDAHQWGEPFVLLPADGADVRLDKK